MYILSLLLAGSVQAADPLSEAKVTVEQVLIEPLAQNEAKRSRFSRAFQPPSIRTVHLLDEEAQRDANGAAFFAFRVDESHGFGRGVSKEGFVGCVYPGSKAVYIKRGVAHVPAALLLGKTRDKADVGVCVVFASKVDL